MAEDQIVDVLQGTLNVFPEDQKVLFSLIVYTILILMYSVFIWKFYRFLASRDIIQLNLSQYNYSNHPVLEKFAAVGLYALEYLIILPFLVFFWFAILSIFLLVLSESQNTLQILLISAAIIASTRVTSYISEDLSKDLAKILPFTILAAFILGTSFFDPDLVITKISQIPSLFDDILTFVAFIFIIEFVFRLLYSIYQLVTSKNEEEM
jgi:predicted permease